MNECDSSYKLEVLFSVPIVLVTCILLWHVCIEDGNQVDKIRLIV